MTDNDGEDDDDSFLQQLIMCEEERRRLYPTAIWAGGYRWFKSPNVVPIEHYRRPESLPQRKVS